MTNAPKASASQQPSFKTRPNTSVIAFAPGPDPQRPWPQRALFLSLLKKRNPNGSPEFVPVTKVEEEEDMRKTFWRSLANHSFLISPPGAGVDCHRTWEIFMLNTVPIVVNTSLFPLYEDLPVMLVDEWEEVFEPGALEKFKKKIMAKFGEEPFDHPGVKEKLTTRYWVDKIQSDLATA
jgi:hypothetical protein